jgi:hypothetical protein
MDIQLPGGSPHVVLISLLHMLHELRYHFASMGVAPCVGKVLLRLGLQVRLRAAGCNTAALSAAAYLALPDIFCVRPFPCVHLCRDYACCSPFVCTCDVSLCQLCQPLFCCQWTAQLLAAILPS